MASRLALITIILVCFNEGTVRATINWEAGTCQLNIQENTPKESLYTINAPEGVEYAYTIKTQSDDGRFKIDAAGELSSDKEFKFDSDEEAYTVQISADSSDDSKDTEIECKILVVKLEFAKNPYSVDTLGNIAKGTDILTVGATYGDALADSNTVEYSIKEAEEEKNFQINSETGAISTKQILTAAAPPTSINLTVIAKDDEFDAITAESKVTVCVGCKRSGSSAPLISLLASMAPFLSVLLMSNTVKFA